MTDAFPEIQCLNTYLHLDGPGRATNFSSFVQGLKKLAMECGDEAAWTWARRAVGPLSDYSSFMKLRRSPARKELRR